jgi:hypothetical protein
MMCVDAVVNVVLGVVAGVLTLLLLQSLPGSHRWSVEVCQRPAHGNPSRTVYEARLGRSRYRLWKKRRGPIDVHFYARLAYKGPGLRGAIERIVEVPVTKSWRPVIARNVYLQFLLDQIPREELAFLERHDDRELAVTLQGLLQPRPGIEAALRVYAFAYRPLWGHDGCGPISTSLTLDIHGALVL